MRVYELATELKIPNKDVIAKLIAMGYSSKVASSSVSNEAVSELRKEYGPALAAAAAEAAAAAAAAANTQAPEPAAVKPSVPAEPKSTPVEPKPAPQAVTPTAAPATPKPTAPVAPVVSTPAPAQPLAAVPAPGPAAVVPKPVPAPAPPPYPSHRSAPARPQNRMDRGRQDQRFAPRPADKPAARPVPTGEKKTVVLRGAIIVRELAEQLGLKPNQLIAEMMMMNVFASINERIDLKVAQQIAEKHGVIIEHEKKAVEHATPPRKTEDEAEAELQDRPEDLESRPPVVTFMGHIDHGKTSLLDRIRNATVAKNEAGGITQHIGAYTVEHNNRKITFLDTPGHAAFTAMRARGANVTDIAVIVVAADDGIMKQTEEAIKHAQAANTHIMIAINKIDLPAANPERVKKQLQAIGLSPEDWGGTTICCPVSAATGQGIDHLLEMILLQSEMSELKANPKARARGNVLESRMEPGMGPTAYLLITRGTLHVGDTLVCGPYWGRVKALVNDHGVKIRSATPSMPVKCMGLSGVPMAGEVFQVYADDRKARQLAGERGTEMRDTQLMTAPKKASLDDLFAQMAKSTQLELRMILKCDTQGSLEAIQKALEDIKSEKVSISSVLTAVGNINENDVLLASASNAIIFGFNVGKEDGVSKLEKREGVEIRLYSIIYQILDDIKVAMAGMLAPELRERSMGKVEVRQVFPISKKGKIAGCLAINGVIRSRCKARVKRKNDVLYDGSIITLKRFQDDVNEVREGQECGIRLDNFSEFETGDIIEFYDVEKIPQKL